MLFYIQYIITNQLTNQNVISDFFLLKKIQNRGINFLLSILTYRSKLVKFDKFFINISNTDPVTYYLN